MTRKLFSFLMVLCLTISMAGCGQKAAEQTTPDDVPETGGDPALQEGGDIDSEDKPPGTT